MDSVLTDNMPRDSTNANFGNFLKALAAHWFSAVSGGLSVPFTVFALYVSGRWQKTLFGTLAIAAGIAASYSVWSQKTEEAEHLTDELGQQRKKNTRPLLRGDIEKVAVVTPPNHPPNTVCDTEIFVKAVVNNDSDCPTTIRSYGLTIDDATGTHVCRLLGGANRWFIRDGDVMQDTAGGVAYTRRART